MLIINTDLKFKMVQAEFFEKNNLNLIEWES